jgi:EpsI family protein
MMKGRRHHSAVAAAAIVAAFLIGSSGLIYRTVAAPVHRAPLDPNALDGFPMQIGEWVGEETPVDPDIEEVIDADAYVSRRYVRQGSGEAIALYLPCATDAPELLQHVPENCYVGAGWTLVDRRPMALSLPGGRTLPCNIVQFARTGLHSGGLLVLHFLVADGEYFTTFSAVAKAKGWRHFAGVRYAVGTADVHEATTTVTDFAREAAPVIQEMLTELKMSSEGGQGDS